jgi:lysozyme
MGKEAAVGATNLMEALKARLRRHEGFSGVVYYDPIGFPTIGYGHRCEANHRPISVAEADDLLSQDIYKASECLMRFPFVADMNITRREALVELVFWVGCNGFKKFKNMIAALTVRDYRLAALELYNSELGRHYSSRARELAILLWEGVP